MSPVSNCNTQVVGSPPPVEKSPLERYSDKYMQDISQIVEETTTEMSQESTRTTKNRTQDCS